MTRRSIISTLSTAALPLCTAGWANAAGPVKIGFLVKQAEEPWFQDEWRYAEQAARDKGFTLGKIGIPNGEKMMAAIDNLAAQKVQGFVICAPDVKLGKAVERAARRNNMKVISVDDRLIDGAGAAIASIPHMGISGYEIGKQVGQGLGVEMKARGWKPADVGLLRVAYDQLPTARERTAGAIDALKAVGYPAANVVEAPQAKTDTESAFNAANIAFTKQPQFKKWIAVGLNDEAVLGAVRAAEGRGMRADAVIGIGIGGSKTALNEFAKPQPTAFSAPWSSARNATATKPPPTCTTGLLPTRCRRRSRSPPAP